MNILADALLPGLDEAFPAPFVLTRYMSPDEIPALLDKQDVLLCRATLKVNSSLLKNHQLRFVATASSGSDHLDRPFLESEKIQIIDAKGCNAISVADYIVACLAYLDQKQLIKGTHAGIIGMGKVGTMVYERLKAANFHIKTYDPPRAIRDDQFLSSDLEQLYQSDLLCIHAELHDNPPYPSNNLIDQHFIDQLKPGCIIINTARGGIVNEEVLLNSSKPLIYCTDVYLNEPNINKQIINRATICTPHIAGHSLEAKFRAVALVSEKLHHLAGLPVPTFATPAKPAVLKENKIWQELVLSIYNPGDETLQLKKALDIKSTFLNLRKNHQSRHDFAVYFDDLND